VEEIGKEITTTHESKEKNYPFDAIVIMPYSSNISSNGKVRLSYYSAQAVHAGFHLWEEKKAPQIIIPGERTFGPEYPSTTELMIRYLKQKGVPESQIIGLESKSTIYQLEAVKKLQHQKPQNFLVVSLEFHRRRVDLLRSRLKIKGETAEAEEILEKHHLKTNRQQLLDLPQTRKFKRADIVARIIAYVDRGGQIQKFISQIRPSITDLHEFSSAKRKLGRLKFKI